MEDLPSGTVTFLFTDIESSSAWWEAEPEHMAALARHDEILNAAISDAGGRVFKHLGDGLSAAFDAALRAPSRPTPSCRTLAAHRAPLTATTSVT